MPIGTDRRPANLGVVVNDTTYANPSTLYVTVRSTINHSIDFIVDMEKEIGVTESGYLVNAVHDSRTVNQDTDVNDAIDYFTYLGGKVL